MGTMEITMPAVTKIREDATAPKKERILIGGKWVDSASGAVFPRCSH
jgi:hypothetical protein